ncbi:MAG: hypothetical protein JZU63_11080, partial [Rhodoferax sp.]|nr:hypothetical protein [Rhodoferax sp.]
RAEIVDYSGNTIIAESFSVVTGDFELQATLQPTPGLTMQLLGSVYTGEQIGPSLFSTGVGMQVSAQQEEVYLLPGTTHFQVELESGSKMENALL